MNKILFIEDNKTKAEDIKKFLIENEVSANITIKESFTSGLKELFSYDYDLLLLDMSLPTRERGINKSMNSFEQLGGFKIMNEMRRKNKSIPTILITMFSEFGLNKKFTNLDELNEILDDKFKDFYLGYVFYTSQNENWKITLLNYFKK